MKHILLLGAGFSRNWGGWLASEVFEYLLGHPNIMINNDLKQLLWNNQSKGGFEEALAELQGKADLNITDRKNLESLELAISDMFNEMNNAFSKIIDWIYKAQINQLANLLMIFWKNLMLFTH